jgi:hypothetical protein
MILRALVVGGLVGLTAAMPEKDVTPEKGAARVVEAAASAIMPAVRSDLGTDPDTLLAVNPALATAKREYSSLAETGAKLHTRRRALGGRGKGAAALASAGAHETRGAAKTDTAAARARDARGVLAAVERAPATVA